MRWLIRNLKIRAKLYLLAGLMLVGMLAVGVLSLLMIGRMNDETAEISDVWLNGVNESRMMNTIIAAVCHRNLGRKAGGEQCQHGAASIGDGCTAAGL